MQALILAATPEKENKWDRNADKVPLVLVDIPGENETYLTTAVKRLSRLPELARIVIVTNDAIKDQIDKRKEFRHSYGVPPEVLSDGTKTFEDRLGAVGDLIYGIHKARIDDDLLIVGGDNWFKFDLDQFVTRAREKSPAVLVAPVLSEGRSSRFGWVDLDDQERIVRFLEHREPEIGGTSLKAFCVYYISHANLHWVGDFEKLNYDEVHINKCSPGTFFAWLSEFITVHGIKMAGISAPDQLEYRDLDRFIYAPNQSQHNWYHAAAMYIQEKCASHKDLIRELRNEDPNVRIVAANLLGRTGTKDKNLITEAERQQIIEALLDALVDSSQNRISYGGSQDDEESCVYVSDTAAKSLTELGYAESVEAVFTRARMSRHARETSD